MPERWVKPQLVAEVEFADWTPDGQIRHAKYVGLRTDKPAKQVTRESGGHAAPVRCRCKRAVKQHQGHAPRPRDRPGQHRLTKLDLVRYYESVADWMLPHLKGRPCSLVRGPEGVTGELFFQKHLGKLQLPGVKTLDPALWPEHEPLLEVATAQGAGRRGADERDRVPHLERAGAHDRQARPHGVRPRPRRGRVVVARAGGRDAGALRSSRSSACKAWLKTSGGKGLHVVVPLAPRHDWDTVKGFSQAVVQHLAQRDARPLLGQERRAQPRRQDLRRLHAQQPRRHHRGGVLGARPARPGRVDAGVVGRS